VAERRGDKLGGSLGKGEGLVFEGLTDPSETTIDGGADADFNFMIGNAHKGIVDGGYRIRLARYEHGKIHTRRGAFPRDRWKESSGNLWIDQLPLFSVGAVQWDD
jgi:hypothetical protein